MVKKKLRIIWDVEAVKSLRQIYEYIKERESASAATRVKQKIIDSAKNLVLFPEKFAREPNLIDLKADLRFKVIWSYKIIYEITATHVCILDIFHTSRDPQRLTDRILKQ